MLHLQDKVTYLDTVVLYFDYSPLYHDFCMICYTLQEVNFRKYLDFSEKDGGSPCDEKAWTESFLYFFRKVCLREQHYQQSHYHYHHHHISIWGYIKQGGLGVFRRMVTLITASRFGLWAKQGHGLKPASGPGQGPGQGRGSLYDKNSPSLLPHNNEATTAATTATNGPRPHRRRLIIKSPVHTARIPLLRRLFPRATFLYLHRHPEEVLTSSAHMADTAYWYCYFNTPTDPHVTSFIFHQFEALWGKYNAAALGRVDRVMSHPDDVGCCRKGNQNVEKDSDEEEYVTVNSNSIDPMSGGSTYNGDGEYDGDHNGGGGGLGDGGGSGVGDQGDGGVDAASVCGNEIHGWSNPVFRDDNLLRLVRRRRQGLGQGSGLAQGQGEGLGLGLGLGDHERHKQGNSSGTSNGSGADCNDRHDSDNGGSRIGSSGSHGVCGAGDGDGSVSRSAAVRRLLYLSDDILEISYRDLVREGCSLPTIILPSLITSIGCNGILSTLKLTIAVYFPSTTTQYYALTDCLISGVRSLPHSVQCV